MATIEFIGLGIMGAHMARNLFKNDHTLTANGKHSVPEDLRSQAATATNSAAVAQAADIVIAMVSDTSGMAEVLFGEDGVVQGLATGKLFIDISSISPTETQNFAKRVGALGADCPDASVSDGEIGMRDATPTIMVDGGEAAFERVKPLPIPTGKDITHADESDAGQTCKMINQIIVALAIKAVGETLLFISKAEADPACMRQALMGGFASLYILEVYGERTIKRASDPGFCIELRWKDLNFALEGTRKLGIVLSSTTAAQQLFNIYTTNGGEAWDHSVMVRALGLMADHTIA